MFIDYSIKLNQYTHLFLQETLLLIGIFFGFCTLLSGKFNRNHTSLILGFSSISCILVTFFNIYSSDSMFLTNPSNLISKCFVLSVFILILILDFYCCKSSQETLLLLSWSLFFVLLLMSSNEWFFLFMSLEGLTLCLYCLIALAKTSRSLESVLKYFAAGAISTCFLLFGIFIRFVSCGLQYGASDYTSFSVFPTHEFAGVIFTVSCISALLLKIGSAPYHYWVADAYEGAPTVVMIFMSTVVKLGIFFILIKVLYNPLFSGMITWSPILRFCAGFSILLGCFGAIFQKSIKRLLAYSSINNVGYILAALSTGTISGIQAALVYIFFYILALILLFSLLLSKPGSNSISYVTDFNRLGTNPLIAIITTLCLFSLAGVPPLSGFLTKFFVLSELFNSKFYVLAIIGAFSSIISSFYYLSLIKLIYFEDKKPQLKVFKPGVPQALLVILSSSLVFFPLFPELVYTISGNIACGLI